ncbi:MAG: U32 family peptidase [Bacteriovoracaceae bacterium]
MKLSVAYNFDLALIEEIKKFPVHEIYGKLQTDFIGGGRSSYLLSHVSRRNFREHVQFAKKNGISFNYLLNAACLDNQEITKNGQKEIYKLLDWISSIEVSAVTISNPLLLRIIKRHYPHLRTRVSVFTCVDHLRKAKYWEEEGADIICLDSLTVNREFKALKNIVDHLKCEVELLVNNNCLQACSLSPAHMNLLAHSSQKKHQNSGFVIDHCVLECSKRKLQDPVNYIRSDWIRPEDIVYYENLGINHFKLVERNLPTPVMVERVKAYTSRNYQGNFLNLIQPYGHKITPKKNIWSKFKFLFKPFKVNVFKLKILLDLAAARGMLTPLYDSPVYIDNKKLDGFIQRFLHTGCRNINCSECKHCHRFAELAITIDPNYSKRCLDLHNRVDEALETRGSGKN